MPFAKGRKKTGGRISGSVNKIVIEHGNIARGLKLLESGFDPISEMIAIAKHPKASLDLKGKMCAELAGYVYAKRRHIEHDGGAGNVIQLVVMQAGQTAPAQPLNGAALDIKALIQE